MKLFNADAIVRSKDAGPFRFTLDVIFNDRNQFEAMKDSGIWNREYLCKLCRIPDSEVDECLCYEPAMAFKFTYQRPVSSGAFGDIVICGSQRPVRLLVGVCWAGGSAGHVCGGG